MQQEQWIVGAEHDNKLLAALNASLQALGYTLDTKSWGVGGSQEVSKWLIHGPKGDLTVEAETYIGLSVTGAPALAHEVRQYFTSVQPANKVTNNAPSTPDATKPRRL